MFPKSTFFISFIADFIRLNTPTTSLPFSSVPPNNIFQPAFNSRIPLPACPIADNNVELNVATPPAPKIMVDNQPSVAPSKLINPFNRFLTIGNTSLPIFFPALLYALPIKASKPVVVAISSSVEPVTALTASKNPFKSSSLPDHKPVLIKASSVIPYWSKLAYAPLIPFERLNIAFSACAELPVKANTYSPNFATFGVASLISPAVVPVAALIALIAGITCCIDIRLLSVVLSTVL